MIGQNLNNAPTVSTVIPHFVFGAFSFLLLTILMFLNADAFTLHFFNPVLLMLTHLASLGWISMMIFGALYQLLPVIFQNKIYSENLARLTFVLFSSGVVILCTSFYFFSSGVYMQIGATLLVFAIALFSCNVLLTSKKSTEKKIEGDLIMSSSLWLLLTAVFGLLMVVNFTFPFLPSNHLHFLKLHAHFGMAGWFILLIMGVASKLLPMFMLSGKLTTKPLHYAYYLVNTALLGFLLNGIFWPEIKLFALFFIIGGSGILCFVYFLYTAYKKRARKLNDQGVSQSLYAIPFLLIPVAIGVFLNFDFAFLKGYSINLNIMYVVSLLFGFITLLILGQTFKTLPFIIWLHVYSKDAGKSKIPMPKNLYSEVLMVIQFLFFIVGYALLMCGVFFSEFLLLEAACILLIICAAVYLGNVMIIVSHLVKKRAVAVSEFNYES